jgi:O-antigen/teichoic acid export membrane protein
MRTIDYKKKSLNSVKWSYAGNILPKIITPIVYFILARLLSPKEFGLIAIAYLVISLVEMSRDAGMSRAVIQSDMDEKTIFDISFVLNCSLGILFFGTIFMAAPEIARFFQNSESYKILRVAAIQIIFSSISINYQSIISKRIDFKKLFYANILPSASLVLVTLPLAYLGYGVWAIIFGKLVASLSRTISFFIALPWVPKFHIELKKFKKFFRFGLYCYFESILGWIYSWGDKAILGRVVFTSSLGEYMFANKSISGITNATLFPLSQIIYPYLCKEKKSQNLNPTIYKLLSYFSIVSFFLCLILFHIASTLPYFIGKQWNNIVFPFTLLSMCATFSMIFTYIIPDAIKAIGKPHILFHFQLLKLFYTLPFFISGANYFGVNGFCTAKFITVIIGCFLFCWLGVHHLGLNYRSIFQSLKNPFLSFLLSFALLTALKIFVLPNVPEIIVLAVILIVGFLSFFNFLFILDKPLIKGFLSQCLRAFPEPLNHAKFLERFV